MMDGFAGAVVILAILLLLGMVVSSFAPEPGELRNQGRAGLSTLVIVLGSHVVFGFLGTVLILAEAWALLVVAGLAQVGVCTWAFITRAGRLRSLRGALPSLADALAVVTRRTNVLLFAVVPVMTVTLLVVFALLVRERATALP